VIVIAMAVSTPPKTSATVSNPRPGLPLTRDEVMTAVEVAELLHLPVSTVYYLASRGEIPAVRLGRAWRFLRPRIEERLGS
jgi:excisionase family DNA binding protein